MSCFFLFPTTLCRFNNKKLILANTPLARYLRIPSEKKTTTYFLLCFFEAQKLLDHLDTELNLPKPKQRGPRNLGGKSARKVASRLLTKKVLFFKIKKLWDKVRITQRGLFDKNGHVKIRFWRPFFGVSTKIMLETPCFLGGWRPIKHSDSWIDHLKSSDPQVAAWRLWGWNDFFLGGDMLQYVDIVNIVDFFGWWLTQT